MAAIWTPADIQGGALELTGDHSRRDAKREYVPSENPGEKPYLIWAPKEELYVPREFQRLVNPGHVGTILSTFEFGFLHPIHTGPKSDLGYPIIDGQHEWLAAMRHDGVTELPLVVAWWADTVAKQAEIFVKINHNRVNITAPAIFYARVAQGDEEALWINSILDQVGVRMSRTMTGNLDPLTTCAIGTLKKLRPCEKWLVMSLDLMARAWPTQRGAFQSSMIIAVTRFIALQEHRLDLDRLHQVLMRISPTDAVTAAKRMGPEAGVPSWEWLVDVLTKKYNERISIDKQIPRLKWNSQVVSSK